MKISELTVPDASMTGLAAEPWNKGEIYAVAARWTDPGAAVMVYGEDGWIPDAHGRCVCHFRHRPADALGTIIIEAAAAGGGEPEDEWVEEVLEASVLLS